MPGTSTCWRLTGWKAVLKKPYLLNTKLNTSQQGDLVAKADSGTLGCIRSVASRWRKVTLPFLLSTGKATSGLPSPVLGSPL